MKRMLRRWTLSTYLGLLVSAVITGGAALSAQSDGELDEVLVLCGVDSQISQIPAQIEEQLKGYDGHENPAAFAVLRQVLPEAFGREHLMVSVRRTFYREARDHDLRSALEWLRSPLAQRIGALTAEVARPEAMEAVLEFFEEYQKTDPDSPRSRLLADLDEAAAVTESGVRLVLEMARSTARGVNRLAPVEQAVSDEVLEDQIAELEPQIRPVLRESTRLMMHYKFRTLEDAEIRQYLEFSRSPDGRWLRESVMKSLVQALRDAGERTGRLIDARAQKF